MVTPTTSLAQHLVDQGARRRRRGIAGAGAGPGIVRPDRSAARGQQQCGSEKDGDITEVAMSHRGALKVVFCKCFQWVHNRQQLRLRHSRYPKLSPAAGSSRMVSQSTEDRPVGLQPVRGLVAGTGWVICQRYCDFFITGIG